MLSQEESDNLLALPKFRESDERYLFPVRSELLEIPIISENGRERFQLDINRGTIRLTKCTFQNRFVKTEILARLDVDGPPHTNPHVFPPPLPRLAKYNGVKMGCPHLHIYVEDFMDKWAIPAPVEYFPNCGDLFQTLEDFENYCNIVDKPVIIQRMVLDEF